MNIWKKKLPNLLDIKDLNYKKIKNVIIEFWVNKAWKINFVY